MAASRWSARGSSVRARGFPGRRRWPGLASYPGQSDRADVEIVEAHSPRAAGHPIIGLGVGRVVEMAQAQGGQARSRRGSGGYRDNPGRAGGLGHNRAGACLWHRCGAAVLPAGCRHPARGAATSSLTEGPRSPAVLHTRCASARTSARRPCQTVRPISPTNRMPQIADAAERYHRRRADRPAGPDLARLEDGRIAGESSGRSGSEDRQP